VLHVLHAMDIISSITPQIAAIALAVLVLLIVTLVLVRLALRDEL
jgi:hypothetical protein